MSLRPSKRAVTLVFVVLLFLLTACGSSNDEAAPETVTVVETEETTVTEPPVTEEEAPPPVDEDSGGGSGGQIRVPDVVGQDHQLAQDTMQAAGLYILAEEDATGQDRLLIWDRNWTVVSQDPSGGTMVSEDQTITLRSKKDDE